ncbi:MAG: poly-beta-1,6-N-acetyl-D-glucosamine biosynthesis protein PgaD [Alphaproteobacteria bacterium]
MRLRDAALSALAWCFYLYLIRGPFLTLVSVLGLETLLTAGRVASASGTDAHGTIGGTLLSYLAVIAHNAMILVVWSLYNFVRFRGHNRRLFARMVTKEDLAKTYRQSADDVGDWQRARRIVMHHDAEGNILHAVATERAPDGGYSSDWTG